MYMYAIKKPREIPRRTTSSFIPIPNYSLSPLLWPCVHPFLTPVFSFAFAITSHSLTLCIAFILCIYNVALYVYHYTRRPNAMLYIYIYHHLSLFRLVSLDSGWFDAPSCLKPIFTTAIEYRFIVIYTYIYTYVYIYIDESAAKSRKCLRCQIS